MVLYVEVGIHALTVPVDGGGIRIVRCLSIGCSAIAGSKEHCEKGNMEEQNFSHDCKGKNLFPNIFRLSEKK